MRATRHAVKWVLVPEAARDAVGALVQLENEKLKHLRKVLRMEWNEPVLVIDGAGRLFEGVLEKQGDGGAVKLERLARQEPPPLPLELVIGLPKNSTMDWVVEKAVECGATRVTPVVSSRSVVQPEDGEKYVRRWQAIMDGAVEQSERLWRPMIASPRPWGEWLPSLGHASAAFAFFSELRGESNEREALERTIRSLGSAGKRSLALVIGPEGGFSDEEREELVRRQITGLSLGPTVLRVETAVIAALTLARASRCAP